MKKNNTIKRMILGGMLISSLFQQTGGELHAQAPNTWTQKANFGGSARDGAFGFAIGSKGYIGGGNNNGSFKNDVWEYNPATDAWTQKAGVPANEYLASSFVIGTKGYVGCGYNTNNAFYEFDPAANTWTAKASLPGTARYITLGLSVGSKGYCGTGYNPNSPYNSFNDFYEFDPIANTWTAKATMPGGTRSYGIGFSIGSKGYAGTGNINGSGVNDFYEYDPTSNIWTQKANVGTIARLLSFGIAMNGKGYVGGGAQGYDPAGFYEYDVTANTWTAKASIPVNRAGAVGFAIGAKLYIGTGGDPFDNNYSSPTYYYRNDFYEWNSCGPVINVSPASAFLCGSGSVTLTASGANTYTWSNGMSNGASVSPSVTTHYTVSGTLSGTCTSTNSAVVTVVVSTTAVNQTISPATSSFACNGSTNLNITTEAGVNYYLRNDANNAVISGPYAGNGSTLNIPTGNIAATTTLNINARRVSGGLTFDGADDYITTPLVPAFNFAGDFTMETWMRSPIGANPGTQVIIGMPGSSDCWLGLTNGGFPTFISAGNSLAGTAVINDGKWHHMAAVRQSGIKYLYVDGVLTATVANTGAVALNSDIEIGGYNGSYNFNGAIDEVRIFNSALTQAQVATSMTACATGQETGLLLYYNFEDGAGSSIADDIAGLDNNGRLVNMNTASAWAFGVESCIACGATQLTTKPVVTINAITNQTVTAVNPNICVSGIGTLTIPGSDLNIDYVLRDNSNNAIIAGPSAGTGSGLSFTTGVISATKTYNVFAKSQSAYLDFDGVDDYVVSTSTVGIPSGNSPYTIEALIKPDVTGTNGTIASWGNHGSTNEACSFRLASTGQLVNYWWGNDITVNAGNLADGAWHHVAATYDGTTRSIFVDGVLVGSDTPTGHNVTVTNNLTVGGSLFSNGSTFNFYKGGIDEVRVWNVSRTQSQIAANKDISLVGNESGLSVYYKFTSGTGSPTVTDYAGGENIGTLTNMNASTAWKYYSTPCSLQMSNTPTVTINALPTVSVTNATICSGTSATLVPSGASTYTITGGTFTVSPSATTSYSVRGTSSVGCVSSNTAVASVSVNASPTLTVNNPMICSGNTAVITSTGANTYSISGSNFSVTPLTTTSYSVTGTSTNGCISLSSAVSTVSVNATPTIAVNSGSICSGNSFTVNPTGANTYTISGGTLTVTPAGTSSYSVTGTATNGCVSSTFVVASVTVNTTPTLSVNSATICSGASVAIVPTGANTYTITGNNFTVSPTANASYSVSGTSTAGCASSNTIVSTVSVNASPTLSVNSATICSGASVAIVPTGANTYSITGNNFTVTPSGTTSYSVTGTATNGCASSNTIVSTVSVNITPTVALNSGSVCSGKSFTFAPSGAGTYTITGNNFTVTPSTLTSYSVTGTSTNGCVAANTATATVSVFTTPTLSVNSATICSGASVAIVPSGAGTYTISGNAFTVTPATTSSYSVTGTSTAGCAASNTIVSTVSVNTTPTVSVNSGSICAGNSFTIVPAGANTYTITNNNYTVTPAITTSYSVSGTSSAGCVSLNTIVSTVTVNTRPALAVNNATICSGSVATLVPTGAASYTVSGGSYTVAPSITTSYSVTGTSSVGCAASNTAVATISVNTTPTLTVNSATICAGGSVALVPTGSDTYSITGNSFTVSPSATTVYSVTGTSTAGCAASNTAVSTVVVNANPTVTANSGAICTGSSFNIVPAGATTYTVSGNSFTVSPTTNTSYSVTGTDLNGCASSTAVIGVTVNALPTVTASVSDATICINQTATLTAGGALTYSWSTSQTDAVIAIVPTGTGTATYTVTGADANGCMSSATIAQSTELCTGIVKQSQSTLIFGVYPNPNNGDFVIETAENTEVTVMNSLGQLVHSETTRSSSTGISITHLANGIYFVKATAGSNQQVVKIIKE